MIPTIQEVINELMFIAVAKPDNINIDVMYDGDMDVIDISAFPRNFRVTSDMTTEKFDQSRLFREHIKLASNGALQKLQKAKADLISLIENKSEVAA
ncbi:MAG: hypothetical protein HRU28_07325 [Rhizobiales bacterium]|nr:hypothetical protein [Hyphomicrobiales bacterium]